MAIRTAVDAGSGRVSITFTLEGDADSVVSVVGSFNGWVPGADQLQAGADGRLSVTVTVPAGEDVHFRYLDSEGRWFDDLDADAVNEHGSLIRAARLQASAQPPAEPTLC